MTDDPRDMIDVSDTADDHAAPAAPSPRPIAPQQGGSFLEGFLAQQNTQPVADEEADSGGEAATIVNTPATTPDELQARVIDVLKQIYDPEIPVNIYDLGLIYGVDVDENMIVTVTMTLTSPHCPVAEIMPGEVEVKSNAVAGAAAAEVKLVWDPPWSLDKMTDEAKLELGLL